MWLTLQYFHPPIRNFGLLSGVIASMPPADIAVKIANALGVTVEYLVTGKEQKKQYKMLSNNVRSVIQILTELSEKDIETLLGFSKVIKTQS